MRRLAIIAAAVIALACSSSPAWADPSPSVSPAATADAPATIIYCAYGDNFYRFVSDYTHDLQFIYSNRLADDGGNTSNDQFCQTDPVGGFTEWVKKGTSLCLTIDATIAYEIDLKGCVAGKASQLWGLVDNQGGEVWNGIESDYTNAGYRYWHSSDKGNYDQCLTGWSPAANSPWEWTLDGPYR